MLVVTDKTIGFTSDGTLLIFDTRAEFAEWAEGREDYEVWAEPKYLFNTLRGYEKIMEEAKDDVEVMTLDSLGQFNGMKRENKEEEGCGCHIRAMKAGEDNSQRKLEESLKHLHQEITEHIHPYVATKIEKIKKREDDSDVD